MIDLHVENGYPDYDTLSIDVELEGGFDIHNITISRDEHGVVHVAITPHKQPTEWHTLGRPGVRRE